MLVDTGASKCMIPASYNREYLKLPTLGKTKGVLTADGRADFDNVSIPMIVLVELVLKFGPDYARLTSVKADLQETSVEAWLGKALVLGINFLSKFDIALKRTGFIVVER